MDLEVKYSGRFRDAVFYFSGSASTSGGRKTITREFPGSDRRYIEDMGLLNKTFEIEAIVTTEQERDKLIKALETPGIGQLSHPTFGLINVTAKPYTVIDSLQTQGYCKFNLTFEVSQENIYPVANSSNVSFLQSKVSFLDDSIISNFVNKLNISPETLQTAISTATSIVNNISTVTEMVSQARNEILEVKENIVSLIQAPAAFIGSVKSIINSVVSFTDDPLAAFDIVKNMFSFSTKKSSFKTIEQQRVANTIIQAVNTTVLSTSYDLVSQIEFENNEQLEEIRNTVEELYEDLIDNPTDFLIDVPESDLEASDDNSELLSTSVLENLQEVRQLVNNILSEKENTVARVVEITTNDTTLNDIVYLYYGNLDRIDKIESMNDISDRSEVSGTLRVLSE